MGKLLKTIVFAIIYLIISYFLNKKHHKIPIICINTGDTAPYQG